MGFDRSSTFIILRDSLIRRSCDERKWFGEEKFSEVAFGRNWSELLGIGVTGESFGVLSL